MKRDNESEADAALDDARRLSDEGRFAEALEKHIWFHDHALEVDEALYGVRLSYALADWVKLGSRYPPALQALIEVRDRNTAEITSGSRSYELFHDVVAINEALGRDDLNVALFFDVERSDPAHARAIFDVVDDSLARSGEYETYSRYLDDPQARIRHLVERRGFEDLDSFGEHRERIAARAHRRFAQDVALLVKILSSTGRGAEADAAVSQAVEAVGIELRPTIEEELRKLDSEPGFDG